MRNNWLSYFNLSDKYERKARFLPGVLSMLPLIPAMVAYGENIDKWINIIISGVGIGAVISVGISHIASAFGNRIQDNLWPDWPNDSPTNRWLHPNDKTISIQQKNIWYNSIMKLTGLDIESAISSGTPEEIKAIINDSIKILRHQFWKAPEASRLDCYNVDYGFARNLTGLRPVWIAFSIGSNLACWGGYAWLNCPIFWCIVSTIISLIAIQLGCLILPSYVRKRAYYYAESFYGTLIAVAKNK